MTAAAEVRRYDFHDARRLAGGVVHALTRWQTEVCTLLSEAWSELAAHPIQVSVGPIDPLHCTAALGRCPDPGLGVLLTLGPDKMPSILAFEPAMLPALFADVLGSSEMEGTGERPLTPLEESLLDLLLGKLRESIADAWLGLQPLPCTVRETLRPRRSRRLAQSEQVVVIQWRIACRFHTGTTHWIIPRRELEEMVSEIEPVGLTPEGGSPNDLQLIAEQFPLDVSIELGQAHLGTAALARLQVGDVLILEQPLHRPLTARVAGEPVWLVEPCRVGQRQAVEIRTLLED